MTLDDLELDTDGQTDGQNWSYKSRNLLRPGVTIHFLSPKRPYTK